MRLTPYEKWELKDKSAKESFKLIDEIVKNWQEAPNKVVQMGWEIFNAKKQEADDAWDVYTNDELRKDRLLAKQVR